MTGHGHAGSRHAPYAIDVEVRSVNNRFLKITPKISEVVAPIEMHLEGIIRDFIRRGTVSISIRVSRDDSQDVAKICQATLRSYVEAAKAAMRDSQIPWSMEIGSILQLPGVLETSVASGSDELLEQVAETVRAAMQDLNRMRTREGQAMASQLLHGIQQIRTLRSKIEERSPTVLEDYRSRLEAKMRAAMSELGHSAEPMDVVREVLVFSDRCDIREELVRLASHLEQFEHSMNHSESQGRRLDFLVQELLRETNTIGSKANDATIAHDVVSIKTLIEQLREMVQNVE
ncbi:MAG: YicC/YloC family endoribonuclease [Planctomycetota bacterium]